MLVLILSVLGTIAAVGALVNMVTEVVEGVLSGAAPVTVESVLLGIVIGFAAVYFLRKNRTARKARAEETAAEAKETGTAAAEPAPLRRMNGSV